MAGFTSYDGLINALTVNQLGQQISIYKQSMSTTAGRGYSSWALGGSVVGGYGTAATTRQVDDTTTGAWSFNNPTGPAQLFMTAAGFVTDVASAGSFYVVDRLMDYASINLATASTPLTNSSTLPRYTTGAGVQMFLEVQTTLGAGAYTVTVTYTNEAGTGSRTSVVTTTASVAANGMAFNGALFLPLQGADKGVRSVESVAVSGTTPTGTMAVVLCKPMGVMVPVFTLGAYVERDLVLQTPKLPRVQDDACMQYLWRAGTSTSGNVSADLFAVEG